MFEFLTDLISDFFTTIVLATIVIGAAIGAGFVLIGLMIHACLP